MTSKRIFIAIAIILLAALAVFLVKNYQSSSPNSKPDQVTPVTEQDYKIVIKNRQVQSSGDVIFNTKEGQKTSFLISSDEHGAIHFHSGENEVKKPIEIAPSNQFYLTFDKAGSYEIEFHPGDQAARDATSSAQDKDSGAEGVKIGTLIVNPK